MKKEILEKIMDVNNTKVRVIKLGENDYISLTDLAKYQNPKNPHDTIKKWMSNYDTIEFLGLWEELSNQNFKQAEFRLIKIDAPKKSFYMTPSQWCERTDATGLIYGKGKYSKGTFAHSDIALEFASWMDNLFKIYLIKEFERLKKKEANQNKTEWQVNRILAKANYLIQTDSIKNYLVPALTDRQKNYIYAEEGDVLNVALFGITAKEWREQNPKLAENGNMRDYTDLLHLIVLNNLENINATLIKNGIDQKERLIILNNTAKSQMRLFNNNQNIKELEKLKEINELDS